MKGKEREVIFTICLMFLPTPTKFANADDSCMSYESSESNEPINTYEQIAQFICFGILMLLIVVMELKEIIAGDKTGKIAAVKVDLHKPVSSCQKNPGHGKVKDGTVDLPKLVCSCKKNPVHEKFSAQNNSNRGCLPLELHHGYARYERCMNIPTIKVNLKIKFTSLDRPEFDSFFEMPYPSYEKRGSHVMRSGKGRFMYMYRYPPDETECSCAKCRVSSRPNRVLGEVSVATQQFNVFDASEARHTTCVFTILDGGKTTVVRLAGWGVEYMEAQSWFAVTEMKYVTCDLALVEELYNLFYPNSQLI